MSTNLTKLRTAMRAASIETIFITRAEDIRWLTKFAGSTAYLLVNQDLAIFATDSRYETHCKNLISNEWQLEIVKSYGTFFNDIANRFKKLTLQPTAPVSFWSIFSKSASVNVDDADILLDCRTIKDRAELNLLDQEYKLAADAFLESVAVWQFGESEQKWAATLEYHMRMLGAKSTSFETIVASGDRGALPHGTASRKIIHPDEAITVDFGSYSFYNSDYTRVIYNGDNREILSVIDIVRVALESAMDKVTEGVRCSDLDKIARDYIASKGYGDYFGHSLGHGVGAEVHERPNISTSSTTVLKEGMVFTIEPGIYLPGRFGIRLEQTVAVTPNGYHLLSHYLDKYVYELA